MKYFFLTALLSTTALFSSTNALAQGAPSASALAAKINAAEAALDAWDISNAQKLARELSETLPDFPGVQGLLGRLKFHEGDYENAVRYLERASESGQMHPMLELAKSTRDETAGMVQKESEHFVMRVPAGKDEILLDLGLESLEQAFDAISKAFDFVPSHKIPVDVLHDTSGLASVSTLTRKEIETSGTIALCKYNRLMITSPKALARGYSWIDTLSHELVHLVISEKSRNNTPIWLHEGLAKYSESLWRGTPGLALQSYSENLLAEAVSKNKLITFEQMHPSMAKLPSQEDTALAFAEVFTVIEFMHKKYGGYASTNALLEGLRDTDNMNRSLNRAVKLDLNGLQKTWKRYLKKRKFKRAPGAQAKKLRFVRNAREDAQNDDDDEAIESAADKRGKKFVRLGNLLKKSGRLKASVIEYQKAFNSMGARSPMLSNRLGGLYIELGEWDKAEPIIERALKTAPDDPRSNILMGRLQLRKKDFEKAKKSYVRSMYENPFNPEGWMALHRIFSEEKNDAEVKRIEKMLNLLSGKASAKSEKNLEHFGLLSVSSKPWGRVFIDGENLAATTPVLEMKLAPGSYFVRVQNDATQDFYSEVVTVAEGANVRLNFALSSGSREEMLAKEQAFVLKKIEALGVKALKEADPISVKQE